MTPVPYCDVHGRMQHVVACRWWRCSGFDGEGCSVQFITDELVAHCMCSRLPGAGITLVLE